jgi:hypothetical protein
MDCSPRRQGKECGQREKAAECGVLAAVARHPEIREQLLEIADQFERLAHHYVFVHRLIIDAEPSGLRQGQ